MMAGVLLLSLLLSVALGLFVRFEGRESFFHDLGEVKQQALLFNTDLNHAETVDVQDQLLANTLFDLQKFYNKGCAKITAERAHKILMLAGERGGNFEERWLGIACLSLQIVQVRKGLAVWPPRKMPLLTREFSIQAISPIDIRDILKEALGYPQLWYSNAWICTIDWRRTELSFWRMITLGAILSIESKHKDFAYYLAQSLCHSQSHKTIEDVEGLLIRAIRMIALRHMLRPTDKFYTCLENSLEKFEELRNIEWSGHVLSILDQYTRGRMERATSFLEVLLHSQLFNIDFWPDEIGRQRATNDILELFTLVIHIGWQSSQRESINALLLANLDRLDWATASPIVLRAFVWQLKTYNYMEIIRKYAPKWMSFNGFVSMLQGLIPAGIEEDKILRRWLKDVEPLTNYFEMIEANHNIALGLHLGQLYHRWVQNKLEWPGMLAAHESLKRTYQGVHGVFDSRTGDLKMDRVNLVRDCALAFSCILFEVRYGIPREFIPSKCFLEAVLYYHRNHRYFDWEGLHQKSNKVCSFPKDYNNRILYLAVLKEAATELSTSGFSFLSDAKALHMAMRGGESSGSDGPIKGLAGQVANMNIY